MRFVTFKINKIVGAFVNHHAYISGAQRGAKASLNVGYLFSFDCLIELFTLLQIRLAASLTKRALTFTY